MYSVIGRDGEGHDPCDQPGDGHVLGHVTLERNGDNGEKYQNIIKHLLWWRVVYIVVDIYKAANCHGRDCVIMMTYFNLFNLSSQLKGTVHRFNTEAAVGVVGKSC